VKINSEFVELLQAFNDENARYLVVGAHAVAYHARRARRTISTSGWRTTQKTRGESIARSLRSARRWNG